MYFGAKSGSFSDVNISSEDPLNKVPSKFFPSKNRILIPFTFILFVVFCESFTAFDNYNSYVNA